MIAGERGLVKSYAGIWLCRRPLGMRISATVTYPNTWIGLSRPAPKTCAGGAPDEMRPGLHDYIPFGRWRISDRNSLRVSSSLRKQPSIELVTAAECCFSTPRIIMHR